MKALKITVVAVAMFTSVTSLANQAVQVKQVTDQMVSKQQATFNQTLNDQLLLDIQKAGIALKYEMATKEAQKTLLVKATSDKNKKDNTVNK
ncbi:hypothetical protein [Thalassotalea agarivorans]|uniref:Uncharacterized protein n=1 Tax=Thalassotalea agarivorans TaxID=349064 RepID=A0A1I0H558_THASX|nr:hypothetical protein [Thalassotalea agarivorans]SET78743.1 hypothetical protein SAMN05660429_02691 [Thalassotalea agarivorans]